HYDRDYASDVEGYPGLVTHGPLQALAMAEAARPKDNGGSIGRTFTYRLVSPLFDYQGLIARATPDGLRIVTSIRDRSGRQTAHGVLTNGIA
ncbi:MAG: mesaconyl-C4 CoA hydratase, partial [Stackebrandtia sp.]